MNKLAIVQLVTTPVQDGGGPRRGFPVIPYDPEKGDSWQLVKDRLAGTGAVSVLLQFSHETLTVPEHGWSHLDLHFRRYRRLYDAVTVMQSASPLLFLDHTPADPLPGLAIEAQPLPSGGPNQSLNRLIYAFQTGSWDSLKNHWDPDSRDPDHLLACSCYYLRTNRFEEAYAASRRALSLQEEDHIKPADPALLWRAHGLQAAKCGRSGEAFLAFRMSHAEKPALAPLLDWADELIRQGKIGEEITAPIEQWLGRSAASEEQMILLLYALGSHKEALERLGRLDLTALPLYFTHIRFECLVRLGHLAEAVLFLRSLNEEHREQYPVDHLVGRMLLADGNAAPVAEGLPPHELEALMERLILLRQFHLAEALKPYAGEPLLYAFLLYRNGFVMRSAAYFLEAMRDATIDSRGMRCLAEILYHRKAYEQASGIFEYLLSESPDDPALRTALALACLRQSETLLNESMYIFPSSVFLREEADKAAAGIKRMEQSGVMARWRLAEVGNFHE